MGILENSIHQSIEEINSVHTTSIIYQLCKTMKLLSITSILAVVATMAPLDTVRACDSMPTLRKWFTAFWLNDAAGEDNLKDTVLSYHVSESEQDEVPEPQSIPSKLTSQTPMVQVFGEQVGQSPCNYFAVMIYESDSKGKCEASGKVRFLRGNLLPNTAWNHYALRDNSAQLPDFLAQDMIKYEKLQEGDYCMEIVEHKEHLPKSPSPSAEQTKSRSAIMDSYLKQYGVREINIQTKPETDGIIYCGEGYKNTQCTSTWYPKIPFKVVS